MTVATGCPMERAIAEAYAWLILWMEPTTAGTAGGPTTCSPTSANYPSAIMRSAPWQRKSTSAI